MALIMEPCWGWAMEQWLRPWTVEQWRTIDHQGETDGARDQDRVGGCTEDHRRGAEDSMAVTVQAESLATASMALT